MNEVKIFNDLNILSVDKIISKKPFNYDGAFGFGMENSTDIYF